MTCESPGAELHMTPCAAGLPVMSASRGPTGSWVAVCPMSMRSEAGSTPPRPSSQPPPVPGEQDATAPGLDGAGKPIQNPDPPARAMQEREALKEIDFLFLFFIFLGGLLA